MISERLTGRVPRLRLLFAVRTFFESPARRQSFHCKAEPARTFAPRPGPRYTPPELAPYSPDRSSVDRVSIACPRRYSARDRKYLSRQIWSRWLAERYFRSRAEY